MKQKLLLAIFGLLLLSLNAISQNGYIYIHNKSINEANSTDFTCNITGGPTSISQFVLNDKPDYIQVGDIGASHSTSTGTTGNGELWAISNGSAAYGSSYGVSAITGTVYHRAAASSQWSAITMPSGVTANNIDGAGPGACVYTSTVGDVYYYNGTSTFKIFCGNGGSPSGSLGNANDVSFGYTANRTAILSSNGNIYIFNPSGTGAGSYAANNTNAAGTTASNTNWTAITVSGVSGLNTATRLDMNYAGDKVVYTAAGPAFVYFNANNSGSATTVTLNNTGVTTVNGSTGALSGANRPTDIAYDDNGVIYCEANISVTNCSSTFGTPIIFRWVSGTTFTEEGAGRQLSRLTGSAAGQMWGVSDYGFANTIWTRATDNSSTVVWLDDERVRTAAGVTNGNSIMIPVTAGTYTFTETIPNSNYDLGRYNIYDPTNNTSGSVGTNTVTINVAAGEVVNIELINEYLVPKSISLTCTTQTLQSFDAGTGSGQFGTGSYGTAVEGTAYHYISSSSPQDGDYYLVKSTVTSGGSQNWYTGGDVLSDNTGNGGYFLLVNASYAYDEFYRQRVTNLVPGLTYVITFYMANALTCNPIKPNIQYGLQDLNGNYLPPQTTGDISATGWQKQTYTFTATTSTADLYLKNINIGGLGNDVALDDISLNPVLTTLGANQISPTVTPNLCIGTPYTFSNTPTGGIWTSSNSAVASINPTTGVATTKTAGTVIITYTYTNQVGCISDTTRELIVSAAPTVTASDLLGGTSCLNQSDSLYATATSTNAISSYAWVASPSATATISNASIANTSVLPTAAGNYTFTVTATDVVGCAASASVSLVVSSHSAPTVSLATSGADCVGNTGNFVLTSSQSGGSGSYSWSWSGTPTGNGIVNANSTSTTASPTAAGSYTYTVKVNDGFCTVPVSKTVTAYASPSITVSPASGSSYSLCKGPSSTASIPLTSIPSGGSGTYSTFLWTTTGGSAAGLGATNTQNTTASPTTTNTSPGYTYSAKVTDNNGCTATASTTIKVTITSVLVNPPTLNITSPTGTPSACSGQSVSLTATASGLGGLTYTYLWTGSGTITNSTSLTTASAVPTASGAYVLTATESLSGCQASVESPVVTVNAVPSVTASNFSAASCSSNSVDSLYAVASGGTGSYTYAWTTTTVPLGGSASIAASTNDTTAVTGFNGDGTYTFQVTATNSGVVGNTCSATATTSILYKYSTGPAITNMASAASYCLGSQISFSPTVTAGVTYALQTSNNTVSSSSTSNPSNTIDGSISTFGVTGSSGTRYIGLDFGSGNSKTITFAEVYIPNSTAATALQGAKVDRSSDGSSWTNIGTFSTSISSSAHWETLSFSNSTAARYIRISRTSSVALTIYEMQFYSSAATSSTNTYLWTATPAGNGLGATGTKNTTATPTAAGSYTYTLKVSDANSCANTANTGTQTINPVPSASPLANNPAFCGTTGSVSLFGNASGGTSPLTYSWSSTLVSGSATVALDDNTLQNPTATLSSATNGSTLKFTITVTDANSCIGSGSTSSIVVSSIPVASATSSLASTACVGQTINLTGKVTGTTTAPYLYSWTPSSNSTVTTSSIQTSATTITTTASTTTAGNYQYGLSVFDANNCQATASTTSVIPINDNPVITLAADKTSVCANPLTTINLTGTLSTGTTSPYTYAWSGSGVTNNTSSITTTAAPTTSGNEQLIITDANSCKDTATVAITVDQATPYALGQNCGTRSGVGYVQLYEQNGVSWTWATLSGGQRYYTDNTLSPLTDSATSHLQGPYVIKTGTYTVTITNSAGCIGSGTVVISSTTCGTVLPVSLLDFTAQKAKDYVALTWGTASEVNSDYFAVERSVNGFNWQTIGTVKAHGNSTIRQDYKYLDENPYMGINYYRLRQVDADGHFAYSEIRTVDFTNKWLVHIYPNPATDYLILEINSEKEDKGSISIQTSLGSTVFIKEQTLNKGRNLIRLNQIQPLAQGSYIITFATKDNIYRSKFVKGGK